MSNTNTTKRGPGRPAGGGYDLTIPIKFLVTPAERETLTRIAADQGIPLATVVRQAVVRSLRDREQPR